MKEAEVRSKRVGKGDVVNKVTWVPFNKADSRADSRERGVLFLNSRCFSGKMDTIHKNSPSFELCENH